MGTETPRKVALVGTASSRVHAPVDDETWEIWGLAARGDQIKRADRWFELHRLEGEPPDWANAWREKIREFSQDCEVLMFYPEPDLGPRVTQFPIDRITRRFGTYFMTSTFSWTMALAIDEMRPPGAAPVDNGDTIGIWGVDMEYGTEYREQRVGFRHFIDLARLMGIRVERMASSGLSYEPVPYPLWQDDPLLNKAKLRKAQTESQLREYDETLRRTRALITQDEAVLAELDRIENEPGYDFAIRRKQLEKELEGLMQTSGGLSKDIMTAEGANEEQSWLLDYLQP